VALKSLKTIKLLLHSSLFKDRFIQVDAIRMCFSKEAGSPLTVFEIPEGYVQKPYSLLLDDAPTQGDDIERISTGTRFAVEQWIMLDNLSH